MAPSLSRRVSLLLPLCLFLSTPNVRASSLPENRGNSGGESLQRAVSTWRHRLGSLVQGKSGEPVLNPITEVPQLIETTPRDNEEKKDSLELSPSRLETANNRASPQKSAKTSSSPFSFAAVGSILGKVLRNSEVQHSLVKGCQLSILFCLSLEIVKALAEVVNEEFSSSSSSSSPLYVSHDDLQKMLHPQGEKKKQKISTPPDHLMQICTKLMASGLPLTSEEENSVEKVLSSLTKAEAALLGQTLWVPPPSEDRKGDIQESWHSIAGLQHVKDALLDLAVGLHQKPLLGDDNFRPSFLKNTLPSGVLLYGPPGCGKTLLVKALAQTARARTLVVMPSVLLRKYIGDTNLQVRSLFSLAQKLAPCIILIDELDGIFRERSLTEHEVSRDLKTEFLQWWDGIMTPEKGKQNNSHAGGILVVGATNRPFEVDSAVLRRMPQSFFVGLPTDEARYELLSSLLEDIPLAGDISIDELNIAMRAYSPSDLQQVLRTAWTFGPLRTARLHGSPSAESLRPLDRNDFIVALQRIAPTPLTPTYRQALEEFSRGAMNSGHHPQQQHQANVPGFYDIGTVQANVFPSDNPNNAVLPDVDESSQQEWSSEEYGDSQESEYDEDGASSSDRDAL